MNFWPPAKPGKAPTARGSEPSRAMTALARLADRRPYVTGWVAFLLVVSLLVAPIFLTGGPTDATGGTGRLDLTGTPGSSFFQWIYAGLVVAVIWALGWGRRTTLVGPSDREGLKLWAWFAVPLGLIYLAVISAALSMPARPDVVQALIWTAVFALAVGVGEEALFRGLLMGTLRARHSAGRALVISSAVFAVAHAGNALWGQSPLLTAQQVGFTFAIGALFGAIALQTASLWPAILLHAVWDAYAISALLIDTPGATDHSVTAEGRIADSGLELSVFFGALTAIVLISALARLVFVRWRRRTARDASGPPPLPSRD